MRNQILTTHDDKHSGESLFPPLRRRELDINGLTMDESQTSKRELEQLYIEAQEYDFLTDRTPRVLLDYWEEED